MPLYCSWTTLYNPSSIKPAKPPDFFPLTHHLPQPEQTSAANKQQDLDEGAQPGWDNEDYSSKKTCETPNWDDEGTPAVQAWEDHRAAAEAEASQPGWEDEEEAGWGEEGAQVGQEQL